MKNPFIENKTGILGYLSVWIIITINHLIAVKSLSDIRFDYALAEAIIYNFIFMILGLSLWYPSIYLNLEKNKFWKTISNHLAGGVITSLIWIYSGYFILSGIIDSQAYKTFLDDSLIWRFNLGLIFYSATIVFYYVAYYYKGYKEKTKSESELNSLVREAELRSLKYQINPHFIFNSLNSISSLTISDPEKAREMTIKLSMFMRKTLSSNENQMTSLKSELENCRIYMDIEKTRFDENLEFVEELSPECKKITVPNMILQPLFENAIKHGIYESTEKITIKLSCSSENGYLKITVQNNFDPEGVSRKGEGIGLTNIKNRLKLTYNQDNLLTFAKLENIFTVNIYIPLEN